MILSLKIIQKLLILHHLKLNTQFGEKTKVLSNTYNII